MANAESQVRYAGTDVLAGITSINSTSGRPTIEGK